ncbi:MAG: hypothetical protein Q9220_005133 [cf. Caloplaca sp. 1 TL-2023]
MRRQYWWSGQDGNDERDKDGSIQTGESESSNFATPVHYRRDPRQINPVPRRIYILGVGNIGSFVAHSLAGIPNRPPITLLLSSPRRLTAWSEHGQAIKLTTDGLMDAKLQFDVEYARRPSPEQAGKKEEEGDGQQSDEDALAAPTNSPDSRKEDTIHNLIVSVKAYHTVDALKRVSHRLTPESSVLFIQNGMGIVEEVNTHVFPDPAKRPQYILGVVSHGIYQTGQFSFTHAGHGTIALAILPRTVRGITPYFESTSLYLLRTMTRTPVLAAVGFAPTDLLQLQLEKLAVNAIINPLTALLGCQNGDLLHRPSLSRVIRLLLSEISLVIKALPELQGITNVGVRFDIRRLEGQIIGVATKTAANRSSTLQDIDNGRATEIDYITGYIFRRGEEVGIQCVLNYMLMHMVKAKARLEGERRGNLLPFEPESSD